MSINVQFCQVLQVLEVNLDLGHADIRLNTFIVIGLIQLEPVVLKLLVLAFAIPVVLLTKFGLKRLSNETLHVSQLVSVGVGILKHLNFHQGSLCCL